MSMRYSLRRRARGGAPRDAVLRDDVQPRHLPQGLDRGHQARHPVGVHRAAARTSRPTSGSSTTRPRTGRRPTTSPPSMPEKLAELQAAVRDRGDQVQRVPARPALRRALQPRDGRPAQPGRRHHASSCSAACTASRRTSVINIKNKSHAVTAEIEVPGRRRPRRDRRPGRQHGRLDALRPRGPAALRLQLHRRQALLPSPTDALAAGRAPTRCGWSSPTTAAASARAAPSRSTSTATRSARAASSAPTGASSRWTRRPRSAATPARRCPTTTARGDNAFTGKVNWVQIDIDAAAEDLDHLISPEERFRLAMAKQ